MRMSFLIFLAILGAVSSTKASHFQNFQDDTSLINLDFDVPGVSPQCTQHWKDFQLRLKSGIGTGLNRDDHWALKSRAT